MFLLCDFFDFFREIFNEQEKFSILTSFFLAPNFFAKVLSSFDLWPIKYCIFLHNQKFSLEEAKFFTVPAKKKVDILLNPERINMQLKYFASFRFI